MTKNESDPKRICPEHGEIRTKVKILCDDIAGFRDSVEKRMKISTFVIVMTIIMPLSIAVAGFLNSSISKDVTRIETAYQKNSEYNRSKIDMILEQSRQTSKDISELRAEVQIYAHELQAEIFRSKEVDEECLDHLKYSK